MQFGTLGIEYIAGPLRLTNKFSIVAAAAVDGQHLLSPDHPYDAPQFGDIGATG
jgi:hypothetical protein